MVNDDSESAVHTWVWYLNGKFRNVCVSVCVCVGVGVGVGVSVGGWVVGRRQDSFQDSFKVSGCGLEI